MPPQTVLIVTHDSGLGGTSRSAVLSARALQTQGISTLCLCPPETHPSRIEQMRSFGAVLHHIDEINWNNIGAIHFHFSSYSKKQNKLLEDLSASIHISPRKLGVPILINNIFAAPDSELNKWPGRRACTVLGEWAKVQYLSHYAAPTHIPFVVGNPQDTDFFRAPSISERLNARNILNIASNESLIFRPGSPIWAKWSKSYYTLAEAVSQSQYRKLIVAGAPADLSKALAQRKFVTSFESISDDKILRNIYWASDVLAVDASRGESFGNVILESLLCGCPVVYRAREFRDNTPWQFRSHPGFTYARTENDFIRAVLSSPPSSGLQINERINKSTLAAQYSLNSVGRQLVNIFNNLMLEATEHSWISDTDSTGRNIPWPMRAKIYTLHNPAATFLKQMKLVYGPQLRRPASRQAL